jgi:hypothetical protein
MVDMSEIKLICEKYCEANDKCDEELDRHFVAQHINEHGERLVGHDYSALDHWSTRSFHFYSELVKLVPDEQQRMNVIFNVRSRMG